MYYGVLTTLLRKVDNCSYSQLSLHQNIIAQTSGPIINSFGTISEDINDDLLERVLTRPTPSKLSHSAAIEMIKTLQFEFLFSVVF